VAKQKQAYDIAEMTSALTDLFRYSIKDGDFSTVSEDAITHGLETSEDNGMITIKSRQFDKYMILSVSDNGKGVSAQKLELLKDNLNSSGKVLPNSIGLVNVNERIKLYYGYGYGLNISRSDTGGFSVDIKLPVSDTKISI